MRRIERQYQMQAFAVDFDIGRKTQVILDVAVARQRIDRILALEFGKQFLRRLAKYVDQQIEAATMRPADDDQIGRASCRERVCQYVSISVVAVALKKQKFNKTTLTSMQ